MTSSFRARIARRRELWWGPPASVRARLHRLRELAGQRGVQDPASVWRCCDIWPRQLLAKHNGRVFAVRHGCRVPALHWQGRWMARIPWLDLPPRVVIKPSVGAAGRGAFVVADGRELLGGTTMSLAQLRAAVHAAHGRFCRYPLIVEDLVSDGARPGALPTEYKCYVFGDAVGAVEMIQRRARKQVREAVYSPDWRIMPQRFRTEKYAVADPAPAPPHLDEMLACASKLGAAIGTFMRIDFYQSEGGCVFGEFSSAPTRGRYFTEHADRFFGELWDKHCPDRT